MRFNLCRLHFVMSMRALLAQCPSLHLFIVSGFYELEPGTD